MEAPIHSVVETVIFTGQLGRLGLSETERAHIYDIYARSPDHGSVLRRTGGLRKGRVAKEGEGKSGRYRVFSVFFNTDHPVFLLWIIDKSRDATLTAAQEAAFKKLTAQLKQECR